MNEGLRSALAGALENVGVTGYRDTTDSRLRPRWRASFSYSGQLHGSESCYLHVFVPEDADEVRVHCTVPAPALDSASRAGIQQILVGIDAENAPGTPRWEELLAGLGAGPEDVREWRSELTPHSGISHWMVLARVALPVAEFADHSLDLATRIGVRLAQHGRDELTARWLESRERG
jgi:hypothetical protein